MFWVQFLSFATISDLKKSFKGNKFVYSLPNFFIDVLIFHDTLIKTKKLTLPYNY